MKKVKDELILSALIANPTIRAASAACGVSESQIYARLRTSEFKNKYDAARRELLERHTAALQGHLGAAVSTLVEVCTDKEAAPQVRVNAAQGIINGCLRLTDQVDGVQRTNELERIVQELEDKSL